MEEILNQYCKQDNPGLLLLSMPTGSGKTYNLLKFIHSNYKEFVKQERKILFITNLKKNLPMDELKKLFIDNGNEQDFQKYVLFIDYNVDPIIKNLLNIDHQIPDKFKTEIYLQLKKYIEILQNEQIPISFKESIKTEIRKNIEPAFRDIIKKTLSENFENKKARLSAIKNNQDYQWIKELYPAVFTDDKTILFLSINKFVAQNTTLVEPSYYFPERLINKSLIFIDEFDTTKDAVLKNIIQSGLRHQVDLLDLFLNIHNHLMQTECPEALVQESKWRKKQSSGKNWLSLQEQIESLREKANYIFKQYQLQHICKSHDSFSSKERNFLFYDYKFHNVLARNQRVEIIGDIDSRTNWINAFNIKEKKTGTDLQELLSTITDFYLIFRQKLSI
ncbi:DEAD/DEAH box helicase family protein [uncultured Nostoc sp.]|uniref:DEAD/DEAH box helicase family protein n=1 Tax=uncultured Nostoc sp. TaxID=340711 RepID=UPI0035CB03FA